MKKRTVLIILGLAGLAVAGVITLVLLRGFLFVPFRNPSRSMYPGLEPDAIVFVNRFDRTPDYGKVLVFHYPENPAQDFEKRVVGREGDTIETTGAIVTINKWELPHCDVGKAAYDDTEVIPPHHEGMLTLEWLGDETYLVFHDDAVSSPHFGPFTVKHGDYFVLGDNRENSHDSRSWFGGFGGGVANDFTVGRARIGKLALPRGAESLKPALDACLAKKPAKTRP